MTYVGSKFLEVETLILLCIAAQEARKLRAEQGRRAA